MIRLVDDLLFHTAVLHPQRPALVFEGKTTSYSALAAAVRRLAQALRSAGICPGERIGIYLDKRPEAVIALMATAAVGAIFVPINPALKSLQVAHLVKDCGIKLLFTSRNRIAELDGALADCTSLDRIIFIEDEPKAPACGNIPCESSRHFVEANSNGELALARGSDMEAVGILYTSGSTGEPKGVVLSHRNFVSRASCVSGYLNLMPEDRVLNLPHYSFGFGLDQLFNAFYVGACSVLHNYVTPHGLMQTIVDEQVTGIAAVPTALMALTVLEWPQQTRETVRYIAAAGGRMPENTTRALRCLAPNADIYLMYGQTETLRSTYLPPNEVDRRPNSIGKAISVAEIYVVRPDGTLCDSNEPGELVQTGETVALGYWNDPQRTAQIFRPAPVVAPGQSEPAIAVWSGDVVSRDEEGFLYYIGRRDDLIKTSGYRVSPTEIEDVLHASGLVETAAVVGISHDDLGQAIVAFVTTRENIDLDQEALIAHCRRVLPNYMLPYQIVQRTTLPLNANSKIDRRRLVSEYVEQGHQLAPERVRAHSVNSPSDGFAARVAVSVLELVGVRRKSVESVGEIFASTFGTKSIDHSNSFSSLGGDSLSYVDVSTALEDFFGYVPADWENMSIGTLEKLERSAPTTTTVPPDVFLRAAAILGVVSLHNRYTNFSGGVSLLFLLSGLSFARFAWNSDPAQVRRSIFGTLLKIVVPTMVLLLGFFLGYGIYQWSVVLFVDNLVNFTSPIWWEGAWFVEVLAQILLIMGVLASLPGVCTFGEKHRYAFGLMLAIGAILLHYGIAVTVHSPMLSFQNLPQYFLWQFGLGWVVFASRTQVQRVVTLSILCGCIAALFLFRNKTGDTMLTSHGPYWLLVGGPLLLWMPPLSLPRVLAWPIVTVAKATLFIYLFHWSFDEFAFHRFHVHGGPVGVLVGFAGSLTVWVLYESLIRAFRSIRGASQQSDEVFA